MPLVFLFFGFRFSFFSNDHEPVHVHINKGDAEAKYNIKPIQMVYNRGFKKQELALIETIIADNEEVIEERWKAYFKQD